MITMSLPMASILVKALTFIAALVFFRPVVHALPVDDGAVGTVWTFPNLTWIENLAVRQSGSLLCTSLNRAAIYQVDPLRHTETTVHQFTPTDGVLGIAEVENDIFIVATANISTATSTAWPGSAKLWRLDMIAWELGDIDVVDLIVNPPEVGLPDEIAALPNDPGVVLLADAANGVIWRIDIYTGAHVIAIEDDLFAISNPLIPLGVDGIHIHDNELYFTNLGANLLGKVPITDNGTATGPIQNITDQLIIPDDFEVAADGTVYVVGDNTLWRVSSDGQVDVLAGGAQDITLEGATAARLGRTRDDAGVLYISTNGGLLQAVDGVIHGGQVLALNVEQYK